MMFYATAVIGVCAVINCYLIAGDFLKINPLKVISGIESRDDFMRRNLSVYKIYSYANRNLPIDSKIFLVGMKNYSFLLDRNCFSDSMFETYTIGRLLSSSASTPVFHEKLRTMGFTHIMYDENSVLGSKSLLSPQEKELFKQFKDQFLNPIESDHSYYLGKILS